MVELAIHPMKLKGHWRLTTEQYNFCSYLLNLYRLHTGHKFDKHLRGWLFFNQKIRLHADEFLQFESLFNLCADDHEKGGKLVCGYGCHDYKVCQSIYNIISNMSDYSPDKIGGSDDSYYPEPPIVHGEAARFLRFLDSSRF